MLSPGEFVLLLQPYKGRKTIFISPDGSKREGKLTKATVHTLPHLGILQTRGAVDIWVSGYGIVTRDFPLTSIEIIEDTENALVLYVEERPGKNPALIHFTHEAVEVKVSP